jgi:hypothetical protein
VTPFGVLLDIVFFQYLGTAIVVIFGVVMATGAVFVFAANIAIWLRKI